MKHKMWLEKMTEEIEPTFEFLMIVFMWQYSNDFRNTVKDFIKNVLDESTSKQRAVIFGRYLFDKTYNQIGEELGITAERCRNIEQMMIKRILRKMEERLDYENGRP